MNPGDVAQSVLPLTSSDLSLITLFLHAHWLVKCVMIGLLMASVWVSKLRFHSRMAATNNAAIECAGRADSAL